MTVAKAASRVGIHRSTLYRVLKKNPRLRREDGTIDVRGLRQYKTRPNKIGRPYGKAVICPFKREPKSEWEGRLWINGITPQKMRHALRRWAEDCGFRGEMEKVTGLANDLLEGAKKGVEAQKSCANLNFPFDLYGTPKDYGEFKSMIRRERRIGEPLIGVRKIGSL